MEEYKFSNRCVYKDTFSNQIYRLNKKASMKNNGNYYICLIKNCKSKLKIEEGKLTIYGAEHSHSVEIAKNEFKNYMFDKELKESLNNSAFNSFDPAKLYETVLEKFKDLKTEKRHKKKKVQIIRTHRCKTDKKSSEKASIEIDSQLNNNKLLHKQSSPNKANYIANKSHSFITESNFTK